MKQGWIYTADGRVIQKGTAEHDAYVADRAIDAPLVFGDEGVFVSPIDGQAYSGKTGMREHNRRHDVINNRDLAGLPVGVDPARARRHPRPRTPRAPPSDLSLQPCARAIWKDNKCHPKFSTAESSPLKPPNRRFARRWRVSSRPTPSRRPRRPGDPPADGQQPGAGPDPRARCVRAASAKAQQEAAKCPRRLGVPDAKEVQQAAAPLPGEEPQSPSVEPAPNIDNAPKSWKAGAREKWASLDPEMRAEVHRRERESARAIQESAPIKKFTPNFSSHPAACGQVPGLGHATPSGRRAT